jgi:predicted adenylyl cyclase CyaB
MTIMRGQSDGSQSDQTTMPRNIEIKARVEDIEALAATVTTIADKGPIEIIQDDAFFRCDAGRLKLRTFATGDGELIFYRRNNQTGPKESVYVRSPTSEPETMREALSLAYGQAGRVRKWRTLFIVGRTRVHLDRVTDLGNFLELEVVLDEHEPVEAGVREAHELMTRLSLDSSQLIEGAYIDLLDCAHQDLSAHLGS